MSELRETRELRRRRRAAALDFAVPLLLVGVGLAFVYWPAAPIAVGLLWIFDPHARSTPKGGD